MGFELTGYYIEPFSVGKSKLRRQFLHSRKRTDEDIKTPMRCVEGGGELWDIHTLHLPGPI